MVSRIFLFSALLLFTRFEAKTVAQSPGPRDFLVAGNSLVTQERYDEAIKEYLKIGPAQSDLYSQSLYNIGVCYYELMQTEQAISYYKQALTVRKSDYPRAAYALGVALEDLGRRTDAKEAYLLASKGSGRPYAPALFKLGVIAVTEGELELASDLFRRAALTSGPHSAASRNNLGVTLARLGRLNEAEKQFLIALGQTDGTYTDAQHNLDLCRALLQTARIGKTSSNFELTNHNF